MINQAAVEDLNSAFDEGLKTARHHLVDKVKFEPGEPYTLASPFEPEFGPRVMIYENSDAIKFGWTVKVAENCGIAAKLEEITLSSSNEIGAILIDSDIEANGDFNFKTITIEEKSDNP